jgi:integrase
MPKHKFEGRGNISNDEVDEMLAKCELVTEPERLRCIIAMCHIFGKRINEIVRVKIKDITLSGHQNEKVLRVYFYVSKKKKRGETMAPKPYLKEITVFNTYAKYIGLYLAKRIKECSVLLGEGRINSVPDQYLFAGYGDGSTHRVKHKFKLVDGSLVKDKDGDVEYKTNGNYLTPTRARQMLKIVAPTAWFHLFRTSLATKFAEDDGATEEDLMYWFDWDRVQTAHNYVIHGTKYSSKFSMRRK